jgi:hypothetical protein
MAMKGRLIVHQCHFSLLDVIPVSWNGLVNSNAINLDGIFGP